jgi:hypothetical protein
MTQYALPIDSIPEVEINAALAELDQRASSVAREDYFFGGQLGYYVYVWFDRKVPIYVGVGAPSKLKRYLEHWREAGSKGMTFSRYLAEHKRDIWPALAAANLNNTVAHSLERLLIAAYRRREDGGTLFNVSPGKYPGGGKRGEDTFRAKRSAERAPVEGRYLDQFQVRDRPYACWQTARGDGVVIPDHFGIRVLVKRNPKVGSKNERQFALYEGVRTVGDYRSEYRKARSLGDAKGRLEKDVDGHLFWDSCCQHPGGPLIEIISPSGDPFSRPCLFRGNRR